MMKLSNTILKNSEYTYALKTVIKQNLIQSKQKVNNKNNLHKIHTCIELEKRPVQMNYFSWHDWLMFQLLLLHQACHMYSKIKNKHKLKATVQTTFFKPLQGTEITTDYLNSFIFLLSSCI